MNKLIFLGIIISFLLFTLPANANIYNINITTNTLLFNNNTAFNIYVTSNTLIKGWIGSNSLNLTQIIQSYNTTSFINIPHAYYYKFNFTYGNFIGQSINNLNPLLIINKNTAPQYAPLSLILFSISALISILLILLILGFFNYTSASLMGGIVVFSLAFISALIMIFALLYTTTSIGSVYSINAITQNMIVQSSAISTKFLGSNTLFGLYGYLMIFLDFILGFVFLFMTFISFRRIKNNEKYK